MRKLLIILGLLALPTVALAATVPWNRPIVGQINPLYILDTVFGNIFVATSTTQASTFPYASTTALSSSILTPGNCVQAALGGLLTTIASPCGSSSSTFGTTSLSALYPIFYSQSPLAQFSFLGLSTTSPWLTGQVAYVINGNTLASTPTTTATCSGASSCSAFTIFGSSPVTISSTNSGGTVTQINTTFPIAGGPITTTGTLTFGGLTTSTNPTIGQLPYWTGVNTFGSVATGTVSGSGGITVTAGQSIIGSGLTISCASCALFGYPFTYQTNYGTTTAATTTPLWAQMGIFASSTSHFVNADFINATTTNLGIIGAASNCNGTSALTTNSTGVVGCTAQPQGTVTSVTATYPILSTGGTTPVISTAFGTTTNWGIGNNGFVIIGPTGIPFTAASSSLSLPNAALQNSSVTINTAAPLGGGGAVALGGTLNLTCTGCAVFGYDWTPTSNFGQVMNATSTGIYLRGSPVSLAASSTSWFDLINVGSSTVSTMSTSTFFGNLSVRGQATTSSLVISNTPSCSGTSALNTSASGVVSCGTVTGFSTFGYPFTNPINFGTTTAATTTPIWARFGIYASSTSRIASTTFTVSGTVGIGTETPTDVNANAKLTVAGISSQDIIASTTDNTTLSDAILQAYAPGSRIFMGAHGTNQVSSRYGITLGGWGEIGAFNSTFGTTNGLIIGTNPAVPIVFGTNNTEKMRITSAGLVGIGTTTPGVGLDEWGVSFRQRIATPNGAGGGSINGLEIISSRPDGNSTFESRLGLGFRNDSGTGIVSPQALGGVMFGGQYDTGTRIVDANLLYPASIKGVAEGTFTASNAMPTGITFSTGSTGDTLYAANVTYGTERARITNAGNIGIATTTPSNLLDIFSSTAATAGFSGGGAKGEWSVGFDVTNNMFSIASGTSLSANQRLIIDSTGKVGIGTTTPGVRLSVVQSGSGLNPGIGISPVSSSDLRSTIGFGLNPAVTTGWIMGQGLAANTVQDFYLYDITNDKFPFYVDTSQRVGISSTTPWRTLSVTGTVGLSSSITNAAGTPGSLCYNTSTFEMVKNNAATCTVSSKDYKSDIATLTVNASDLLKKINPTQFEYKDSLQRQRWGFIAEELQAIDPKLGDAYDDQGIARSVDILAIQALTVKALQEQIKRIDQMQANSLPVAGGNFETAKRSVEENYQWGIIGLLVLYVIYNEIRKRK